MILCHKCAGILASNPDENTIGLLDCQCMSGYVRGFEPTLTRQEAIQKQIEQQEMWIALYKRQGRPQNEISVIEKRIGELKCLYA